MICISEPSPPMCNPVENEDKFGLDRRRIPDNPADSTGASFSSRISFRGLSTPIRDNRGVTHDGIFNWTITNPNIGHDAFLFDIVFSYTNQESLAITVTLADGNTTVNSHLHPFNNNLININYF